MLAAGSSFWLSPSSMVGTNVCAFSQARTLMKLPPKLRLWVPRCHVRLLSTEIVGDDRQLIPFCVYQFVNPMSSSRSIAKPPWSAKFCGPLLETLPKFDEPPSAVTPPRSSLTTFCDRVERSDAV